MPFVSDLVRGNPRYDGTPLYYHFKNIPETSLAPFFHLSFFPLCSPFLDILREKVHKLGYSLIFDRLINRKKSWKFMSNLKISTRRTKIRKSMNLGN